MIMTLVDAGVYLGYAHLLAIIVVLAWQWKRLSALAALKRWEVVLLIILVFAGFYFRIAEYTTGGMGDGTLYTDTARMIYEENSFRICKSWYPGSCHMSHFVDHPIGYPLLISILFYFIGVSYISPIILSTALSSLTIALIYLLTKELGNRNYAIIAAAIYTINPLELLYGSTSYSEPTSAFFIAFSLLIFLYCQKKESLFLLFMLIFSYTLKIRLENIVLLPLFTIFYIWNVRKLSRNHIIGIFTFLLFSIDYLAYMFGIQSGYYRVSRFGLSSFYNNLIEYNVPGIMVKFMHPVLIIAFIMAIAFSYRKKYLIYIAGFLALFLPILAWEYHPVFHLKERYFLMFDVFLVPAGVVALGIVLERLMDKRLVFFGLLGIILLSTPFYIDHRLIPYSEIEGYRIPNISDLIDQVPRGSYIVIDQYPELAYFSLYHDQYGIMSLLTFTDNTSLSDFLGASIEKRENIYYLENPTFSSYNQTRPYFFYLMQNRTRLLLGQNEEYTLFVYQVSTE